MTGSRDQSAYSWAMSRHSPIISPETLFAGLARPDLRIVDTRWVLGAPGAGRVGYDAGHLPGAVFLDLDADLAAPSGPGRHPLPDPRAFRRAARGDRHRLGRRGRRVRRRVGLDRGSAVVDARRPRSRARARSSTADSERGSRPAIRSRPTRHRSVREDGSSFATHGATWWIATAWPRGLGSMVLLDARAAPRYLGEIEPIDRVAGAHPDRPERTVERQPRPGWAPARSGDAGRPLPRARRGPLRRPGRHIVRQRRHRLLHQPGDARRRPPRPDPLPGFLLGLDASPASRWPPAPNPARSHRRASLSGLRQTQPSSSRVRRDANSCSKIASGGTNRAHPRFERPDPCTRLARDATIRPTSDSACIRRNGASMHCV